MLISITLLLAVVFVFWRQPARLSQNKAATDLIKFIAALCVVNGHLFAYDYPAGFLSQEMNIGALCVSLFFFLSAYGLFVSYRSKPNYLENFIPARLGKLLLPFATAYAFSLVVYAACRGPIDWRNVAATLTWGGPYMKFSWYVTEIAAVYILFYLSFKFGRTESQKFILLIGLIFIAIVLMVICHAYSWYIISLPAFIIGLLYARYEEYLLSCKVKPMGVLGLGIILAVALGVSLRWEFVFQSFESLSRFRFIYMSYYISNAIFALILTILLSRRMNLTPPNRITCCYYEVYLLQNAAMILASCVVDAFWPKWILTFAIVLVLSMSFHKLNGRIINMIYHRN